MWSLHVPSEFIPQEEAMKNNALQAKLAEMESKLLGGEYYMWSHLIMSLHNCFCWYVFSCWGSLCCFGLWAGAWDRLGEWDRVSSFYIIVLLTCVYSYWESLGEVWFTVCCFDCGMLRPMSVDGAWRKDLRLSQLEATKNQALQDWSGLLVGADLKGVEQRIFWD